MEHERWLLAANGNLILVSLVLLGSSSEAPIWTHLPSFLPGLLPT